MCVGEPVRLQLIQQEGLYSPCLGQPVWLLCKLSGLTSEMFSTSRPSWREDSMVFSIDGQMYHSVRQINQTHTFLELVPQRMHFEEMGSRNYTCTLSLLGGDTLESNPLQIRPISELHYCKSFSFNCWQMSWISANMYSETCSLKIDYVWFLYTQKSSFLQL